MYLVAFARKHPFGTAASSFVLGGATALVAVMCLGMPWNAGRPAEAKPPVAPAPPPPTAEAKLPVAPAPHPPTDPRRVDLVVMQKGKPFGLDSEFREFFVDQTRKMPEVEQVSEGIVGNANVLRDSGIVDDGITLIQGWKPDNFGFEDIDVIAGRKLQPGDRHKVMLGTILAGNLKKAVGDKLTFVGDPDHPYEVIGAYKSRVIFEAGGGIVPFEDGQTLHGRKGKVTGYSVRVKKTSPDSEAEVDVVRQKIEALRDPEDPTVRLTADSTEKWKPSNRN